MKPFQTTYTMNCRKGSLLTTFAAVLLLTLTSCTSRQMLMTTDFQALAAAGNRLGIDIDYKDDHRLFLEASQWLGTPYAYGGQSRRGVDCSGLSSLLYQRVYGIKLSRSSQEQYKKDCRRISRRKLKQGDLVFFRTSSGWRRRCGHVGVYLKDGFFIHASSSRGVEVAHLKETYWKKHWLSGGTVR